MKLEPKDRQILEHIVKYCSEVQMAIQCFGENEGTFTNSPVFMNACSMPLLQIGELAKKLSDNFIASSTDIPWKQIKGMRDFFAHDYHSVNKHIIWLTATKNIPLLQKKCEKILMEA